jgi:hypothetical protein
MATLMAAKFPAVASSNGRATWYVEFENPTSVAQESAAPISIPTASNNKKQRTLSPASENKTNNPPSQPNKPAAAPAIVQLKSPLPTAGSSPALILLSSVDQEQSHKPVSTSKSRSVTPPLGQSPQPIPAVTETISASARSASNPSMSAGVAVSKPTSLPLNAVTSSTSSDAQPPSRSSRLYPGKQATPSPSPSQSEVKPVGASTIRSPVSSQPTTEVASITSPPKLLSTTPTTPSSAPIVDQSKKTAAVPKISEDASAPTRVAERPTSPQQQATATESSTTSKKFENISTVATTTQRAVSPQSMSTVNQVVSHGRSNGSSSNNQPALSAHNAALLSAPQPVAKQPVTQPQNKQPLTRSASQEGSSNNNNKLSNNYQVSTSPTPVSQATVENHLAAAAAASATSGNSPSSSANKKPKRTSILRSISLKLSGSKPVVEKPTVELRRISRQLEEDQLPRPEDNSAKAQVIKENPVSVPVPVPHLPPKQKNQLLMASRSDGAAALPQSIRRTPMPIIARPSVQQTREPIAPPPAAAVSVVSTSSSTTAAAAPITTATTATAAAAATFLTPTQQSSLMVVPLIPPAQPAQQPPAAAPESADLWPQFNTPSSPLSPPATEAASATTNVEHGAGKTDSLESRKKRQRAARSVSVKVAGFDKSTRLTVRPTTPPPEVDGLPRNWDTIMDAVVGVLMMLLSQSTILKPLLQTIKLLINKSVFN